MERFLTSSRLKARLLGFTTTTTGSVCTAAAGTDDATYTSAGTGLHTIALKRVFSKTPVVVAGASWTDVAAQGGARVSAGPTKAGATIKTYSNSDTADNGTASTLFWGTDSSDLSGYKNDTTQVKGTTDRPRLICLRLTQSSGAWSCAVGTTQVRAIVVNGLGDITVSLKYPFSNTNIVAIATPISTAGDRDAYASVVDASNIRVKQFNSGSINDVSFYLVILGSDDRSPSWGKYSPIAVHGRSPRVMAFTLGWSAGAPIFSTEGNVGVTPEATLTDTGTGDVAIAFARPFKGAPVVISSPNTAGRFHVKAAATATGVSMIAANSTGTIADLSSVSMMVFGWDNLDVTL